MLWQGTSVYFPDYGWFFAISMIAVIFAIYYNSINQLNNNMILNFGRAIRARSRRYQKSKHKIPEASHIVKKEPAIESEGQKCCMCLKSLLAPGSQNKNHCNVCGANACTNCSGNSHKDCKCVRHQWAVLPSDMADQSEEASFCCYCKEPYGGVLVADAPVLYCMWCRRLVHVDCLANLAKETGHRCDLGPERNDSQSTKHLHHVDYAGIVTAINGGNNSMATKQDIRATGVSAQTINGIKRKNGENKVGELEFDGTNDEKRLMILLNPVQVIEKNRATCITTARDLEAKKLKLIKTGLDANSIRTCTICNIVCNSDKAFASHIAGEKHMFNSKGLAQVLMSQQAVSSANDSNPDKEPKKKKTNMLSALQAPRVAQSVYCDICKVTCNTQEIYDNHVAGQKHNKKIKKLSMGDRPIQFVPAISTSHGIQTPATDDYGQEHLHTSSQLEPKSIGKSMCGSKEDLEMKKRKVLEKGAKGDEVKVCELCNILCTSQTVFESHCRGQKHRSMVEKQEENFNGVAVAPDVVPTANDNDQVHMHASSQMEAKPIGKSKTALKQDLEIKKRKVLEKGAKGDEVKVCELCNVVCTNPTVFESHCRGQKHRSRVKKQEENFGGLAAVVPTTNDNDQELMHASSQPEPKPKRKVKSACKEDIEMKKRKLLESGVKSDAVKVCTLCNVVCNSATDFEIHCRVGARHKSLVKKQQENFGRFECID